jgi:hypothetical protein
VCATCQPGASCLVPLEVRQAEVGRLGGWDTKISAGIKARRSGAHTTITWVERGYGCSVARAYAGHTNTASAPTATFAKARTGEETWSLVRLREKNNAERWQPVSPSLMQALLDHWRERGAGVARGSQLLRYRSGAPISTRRYDHLWERGGTHLPWAAAQNVSTHWLRHTTLTWVERHFGYGIARAYAGHIDSPGPATTTYIRAALNEIAAALAALTGEPHPLAKSPAIPGDPLSFRALRAARERPRRRAPSAT